ncbi:MAG: LytR/AlgR family response regulator transcription factor [Polaribacter sp.]
MVHCLIIENNKNTIELIQKVSHNFDKILFNNVHEDQDSALKIVLKNKPQIVFFNIESKHINITEFLFEITQYSTDYPYLIALSSSKEKAYEAYKHGFLDFLLKPLTEFSFRKSILKYKKENPIKEEKTICLKSYKDYQYLNIDNILYLKADNNTTDFYMIDGVVISAYKTLKVFENLLPKNFLRVHKSYIVNSNHISRIHYGKHLCIINNKHQIPFTKTFIANINLINTVLSKNNIITLN